MLLAECDPWWTTATGLPPDKAARSGQCRGAGSLVRGVTLRLHQARPLRRPKAITALVACTWPGGARGRRAGAKRSDFRGFVEALRVRWAEVDARASAIPIYLSYVDTAAEAALLAPRLAAACHPGPCSCSGRPRLCATRRWTTARRRASDRLSQASASRRASSGRSSMKVDAANVCRGDELLVLAGMVYVFCPRRTASAQPIVPDAAPAWYPGLQAGQPVVEVATWVNWS